MDKKVYVFLADGFEEVEALTPVDVLRRADIKVTTVSISNSLTVTGSHQISVLADALFTDLDFADADMLVLPGGLPGTHNLNDHKELIDLLLDFSAKGKLIGAICAAPLILGQQKILENKNATCYPGFEDNLINAQYTAQPVEVADNIVTGRGVGAAMKFALQLVAMFKGDDFANELAQKMVVA